MRQIRHRGLVPAQEVAHVVVEPVDSQTEVER
jgi:hypothetical protein